jgi:hypothetical protein
MSNLKIIIGNNKMDVPDIDVDTFQKCLASFGSLPDIQQETEVEAVEKIIDFYFLLFEEKIPREEFKKMPAYQLGAIFLNNLKTVILNPPLDSAELAETVSVSTSGSLELMPPLPPDSTGTPET